MINEDNAYNHLDRSIIKELIKARQKANITQTELAERTGLDINEIVKIELGRRDATIEDLMKISKALGLKMELKLISLE